MKYYLLLFVLLLPLSSAATITGTIYDFGLQPVTNAIVSINTVPEQTTVTQEGHYSLEVPSGTYILRVHKPAAQGLIQQAEANITIAEEGIFTYDLILFQELYEVEEPKLPEVIPEAKEKNTLWPYVYLIIIGLILVVASLFVRPKKKKNIEKNGLEEEVLAFIEKEGTTTQKDIRKAFPHSEAKISLVIAGLEGEEKITKIKKGRGNIIKYNKVS